MGLNEGLEDNNFIYGVNVKSSIDNEKLEKLLDQGKGHVSVHLKDGEAWITIPDPVFSNLEEGEYINVSFGDPISRILVCENEFNNEIKLSSIKTTRSNDKIELRIEGSEFKKISDQEYFTIDLHETIEELKISSY